MIEKVIVFDLDDTLYKEIDYLKSAYLEIAKKFFNENIEFIHEEMIDWYFKKMNPFKQLIEKYELNTSIEEMIQIYRNHYPNIKLENGVKEILQNEKERKNVLGIITDGYSITQRNKIKALEIEKYFDKIIISEEFGSEKPSIQNYKIFMDFYPANSYYYIADNLKKDFISPLKLNWNCILLLDNGKNIHFQDTQNLNDKYTLIKNLNELNLN